VRLDIKHGRWQDVLLGNAFHACITDPPYSARTHESKQTRSDSCEPRGGGYNPAGLAPSYEGWTPDDVHEFVGALSPRVSGWMACMTDSELMPTWREAYESVGRLSFAPVPCVMAGMSVRLAGDGPSSWTVYLMVARPRALEFKNWGTLPGAYVGVPSREAGGGRGKPDWLLRAIVRDYSKQGNLVVDPFAGWGSTLVAALGLGRDAIGCDVDAEAIAEAQSRAARGVQADMFG
jgi:hypothetical protein